MARQSWWRTLLAAIDHAYERRIRSASQITEYGTRHTPPDAADEDAAAIVNVPRGTRLPRPTTTPADPSPPDYTP